MPEHSEPTTAYFFPLPFRRYNDRWRQRIACSRFRGRHHRKHPMKRNAVLIVFFWLASGCKSSIENAFPVGIIIDGQSFCQAVIPEGENHPRAVPDSVGKSHGFYVYYMCNFEDNSGPYFAYILTPPFEEDAQERRQSYKTVGNCTVAFVPMGEFNRRHKPTERTHAVLEYLAQAVEGLTECQK